jgi:hypothetical protein
VTDVDLNALRDRLRPLVAGLYPDSADGVLEALVDLARRWAPHLGPADKGHPDQGTAYLITSGARARRRCTRWRTC